MKKERKKTNFLIEIFKIGWVLISQCHPKVLNVALQELIVRLAQGPSLIFFTAVIESIV